MELQKTNRENRIPNALINSKHEYSSLEKRIFYLIMNDLNPSLENNLKGNRTVNIENVRELIGNPNSKTFKETLSKLNTRQIKYINDHNEVYDFIIPFPRVRYENNTLSIVIFEEVIPDLLDLKKGFTRYQLDSALSLTSHHSQRMYEILSRWKDLKQYTFELEYLKLLLGVENKYPKWTHFEMRVLKVAQKELTEKTDISFTYTKKKKGRKVAEVTFTIFHTQNKSELEDLPINVDAVIGDEEQQRLNEYLDKIGVLDSRLRKVIITEKKREFWKWLSDYKKEKFKINSSISGHLLRTLGLK
jgi:plasmid replication initiation protein